MFKICLTFHKANSSFNYLLRVFIFGTIISNGVSDNCYGLGVKGQCQIYLKSVV